MKYVISRLTETTLNDEQVFVPAAVLECNIDNFITPSCECDGEFLSTTINLPRDSYVAVGLFNNDFDKAVTAGYLEVNPVFLADPAFMAGDE